MRYFPWSTLFFLLSFFNIQVTALILGQPLEMLDDLDRLHAKIGKGPATRYSVAGAAV